MSAFSRSEPAPATPASGAEKSALGDLEFDLGDDLESVDFTGIQSPASRSRSVRQP